MRKQETTRRGKNFGKLEDRQICVSWVYITQDAVKGTDQIASAFWNNVFQNAKTATPSLATRTAEAIRQRFGAISRHVMKFSGCVKSVQRLNKSGSSSTDKLNMALELYKADNSEEFKFLECYEVLKQCPKFNMDQSPKSAEIQSPGPSSSVSELVTTPCTRPIGQKAAKAKLRMDDVEHRKIIVLEQIAKAAEEKNNIMRHSNRIKIATTSLNDLDEISAKILKLEKQKILDELLSSSSQHDSLPVIETASTFAESQDISSDDMIKLATAGLDCTASSSQSVDYDENILFNSARVPLVVHSIDGMQEAFDPRSIIESDYDSD